MSTIFAYPSSTGIAIFFHLMFGKRWPFRFSKCSFSIQVKCCSTCFLENYGKCNHNDITTNFNFHRGEFSWSSLSSPRFTNNLNDLQTNNIYSCKNELSVSAITIVFEAFCCFLHNIGLSRFVKQEDFCKNRGWMWVKLHWTWFRFLNQWHTLIFSFGTLSKVARFSRRFASKNSSMLSVGTPKESTTIGIISM